MEEVAILNTIASEMQVGVLVLDRAGSVLYANPFFSNSFSTVGGERGEARGKPVGELIRNAGLLKAIRTFGSAEPRCSAANIEINEGERIFNVRMVRLEESDNTLLFIRDITEEKRVEAIKRDFVANVSHELRTPLASIKGYSETLLDGGMDDRKTLREFLGVIDRHATRMSRLIDDLLILSRVESQEVSVVSERLDIGELIRSIAPGFEKEARDRGVRLSVDREDGLPDVLADRDRLEQVVVNLLDNAIKYTPSGGRVNVRVLGEDGTVRVDVEDTGIGIPPEDIARIFERFYRVDKARSRELGGTGLGLAIVKHIVHGFNGRVWVESTPGEGSTFSFSLAPAAPPAP
ncbi:MAG: ATP-binding protein [Thermodesulfobacteriota bacterium]